MKLVVRHMSLCPGFSSELAIMYLHVIRWPLDKTYSQTIMSNNLPTVRRIVTHHNPQGLSSIDADSEVIFQVSFIRPLKLNF